MVELIEVRLANLTSETELVLASGVRNDVRQVPGEVAASFRRCEPDLFEIADNNVGSTVNGLPVIFRARAEEEAHGFGVEAIVEVVKELVEVIGAKEHLIGQLRCEGRVKDQRVIEHVERGDFEIVLQVRAGCGGLGRALQSVAEPASARGL